MKDKKFKPIGTGKSYNFDLLNIGKKSIGKDSPPMRIPSEKNKLYQSNDIENERSNFF